jgi:glucose/arabinose dehydrogenase
MTSFDERGLLGLAFHPDYDENGRFFVYYSAPLREGAPEGWNVTSHISEFLVSQDPNRADPTSERILLQIDKPQFNHNAGTVVFGPEGYLYISIGDGGGANDVGLGHVEDWYADNAGGNGQDITDNLLGSILRIDVDGGAPYAIPPDNPFVNKEGLDEIWAYGLRNPYRISFDGARLFAGDAGQGLWEEVSLVVRGGNYGWNVKEGTHCFDAENSSESPADCPDMAPGGVPLRDPVIEYANANNPLGGIGLVVVGGHVYRGSELPQLRGRYVFGDWSRSFAAPDGTLLAATPRKQGLWRIQELLVEGNPGGRLGQFILGFGRDSRGEIYVLTSQQLGPTGNTGRVFRLVKPGR